MALEQLIQDHTLALRKNTEELQALRFALEVLLDHLQSNPSPVPAIAEPAVPTSEVEHFPEQASQAIAAEDLPTAGAEVAAAEEEPKTEPEPEPEPEVTYDMLREAGVKASVRFGRDFIVKNLAAYGVQSLKDLDKKYFSELYKAFREGED